VAEADRIPTPSLLFRQGMPPSETMAEHWWALTSILRFLLVMHDIDHQAEISAQWNLEVLSMSETDLSNDVREFLSRNIRSIEQLEILLVLRASPDQVWTVKEIYQRVMTNEASIRSSLRLLCEQALVRMVDDDSYEFSAKEDFHQVIEKLAGLYKEMPTRVLSALYGPSSDLSAFVQAFRIRPPK
jgi:hypothetical protein